MNLTRVNLPLFDKKEVVSRFSDRKKEEMTSQVRKVLGGADQQLILMVRG